jgi:hypothetical protein
VYGTESDYDAFIREVPPPPPLLLLLQQHQQPGTS